MAFAFRGWPFLVGALSFQVVLWFVVGYAPSRLARQVGKLWGFALFVLASYALTSEADDVDRWVHVRVATMDLKLNVGGALQGALMIGRVLLVVLASQIAKAGDERAIATGLRKLGMPLVFSASVDATLALFAQGGGGGRGRGGGRGGGGGGGRGGGGGGGGGRGRGADAPGAPAQGLWSTIKGIARGDLTPLVHRLEGDIDRAQHQVEDAMTHDGAKAPKERARDIAIIAGVSVAMLGVKALKILPSIPFAPGHKFVVLTPLYLLATRKTHMRFGATMTGLTMGTVAFLMGDGRYGIFEILKHVVPGLVSDLCLPVLLRNRAPDMPPPAWVCALLGGLMGAGRFATVFCVTLAVQPPRVAFAMLIPGFVVHTGFGLLAGLVSKPVLGGAAHAPTAQPASIETGRDS